MTATGTRRRAVGGGLAALVVVLLAVGFGGVLPGRALAASRTVTMTIDDSSGQARLVPSTLTVASGDTVVFRNEGSTAYTVAIARDNYRAFLVPNQSADGAGLDPRAYTAPKTAGTRTVTVTSVTGVPGRSGTITVTAPAATTSRTPTPKPTTPAPRQTAAPQSTQAPVVAPAPPPQPPARGPAPVAIPSLPVPPLLTTPPNGGALPLVAPTPPAAVSSPKPPRVALGGPLEAPTGRGLGLPAALAGVLIVGGVGALVRVLLAEPVDGRRHPVGVTG